MLLLLIKPFFIYSQTDGPKLQFAVNIRRMGLHRVFT